MGGKNEKHPKNVTNPRESVKNVDSFWGVLSYKKVQKSQRHRMSWEHVIPACPEKNNLT